jgi:hypothetical protein
MIHQSNLKEHAVTRRERERRTVSRPPMELVDFHVDQEWIHALPNAHFSQIEFRPTCVSRSTLDMDWTGILVDPYLSKEA